MTAPAARIARVLERHERRAAVSASVAAFWDCSETRHLLPDEARRRHVLPRYLASDCADSLVHHTLFGVSVDGEVAGVAAWLPPEAHPTAPSRQAADVWSMWRDSC